MGRRPVPSLTQLSLESLSDHILQVFHHLPDHAHDDSAGVNTDHAHDDSAGVDTDQWSREMVMILTTHLEQSLHDQLDMLIMQSLSQEWETGNKKMRRLVPELLGSHSKVLDFTCCKMLSDNNRKAS